MEQFREAHGLKDKMCVVSDKNESIIKAVLRTYNIPHYACTFHLWKNVKTLYKKSHDSLSEIFYAMTKAYKHSEFNELMKKVEHVDIRGKIIWNWLVMTNGQECLHHLIEAL